MADEVMQIAVECYAGYTGEQTPRVLILGERRVLVDRVVEQWLAPDHRYFKVFADDGHLYTVRHDSTSGAWELTWFERRL